MKGVWLIRMNPQCQRLYCHLLTRVTILPGVIRLLPWPTLDLCECPRTDSRVYILIDRITNKQSVTLFCVFVYDFCVYCWHSVFTNKAIVFWSVSSKDSNDVTDLDSSFQIKILRKKCSKHAGDLMKINRLQIISCNVFIDLRIHNPYLDG